MQLEVWQILAGLFGSTVVSGTVLKLVDIYFSRRKAAGETTAQSIKNAKDSQELEDVLEQKVEKKVKESVEKNKRIDNLENELKFERGMREAQGKTITEISEKIGASSEREKIALERVNEIKDEMRQLRERNEERDEERHRETLAMFEKLFEVLSKCVITPKTNE